VIGDEALVRMLVVDVLGDAGYCTLEAGDGPEGLKMLRPDVRIELLITDVGLPNGMNGRQVADAACELRPELKVMFVDWLCRNRGSRAWSSRTRHAGHHQVFRHRHTHEAGTGIDQVLIGGEIFFERAMDGPQSRPYRPSPSRAVSCQPTSQTVCGAIATGLEIDDAIYDNCFGSAASISSQKPWLGSGCC